MTSLTLVRHIKARPSIVFDALVSAEGIARWWGPDSGPVVLAQVDARVGGRFKVRFRMLDGNEYESTGEFLELSRFERVAMTWRWSDGMEADAASLIEMVLRPIPEGTELIFTHSKLPDEETARGHAKGWNGSLDKLEAVFK